MAQGQWQLSQTNPNDSTGGGGCICDELKQTDCKPPYVVLYGNTMDSAVSPHVVACARCIGEMYGLLDGEAAIVGNLGDDRTVNPEGISTPFPEQRLGVSHHDSRMRRQGRRVETEPDLYTRLDDESGKPKI